MPVTEEDRLFTSIPPSAAFGLGGRTIGDDNVSLLVGEAEDWIPRTYLHDIDGPNIVSEAQWILVRENPNQNQSRILGRYAYAIFDMSGGIDANLAALDENVGAGDSRVASNRVRRSARQVPMGLLPEVKDGGNVSTFKDLRRGWKGFDSLQMLINLTDGNAEDGNGGSTRWRPDRKEINGAGLASNLVSDLTPFSLSAFRGSRYTRASGLWDPYVAVDGSTDWNTVLAPIAGQFGGSVPGWIGDAIADYTSASATPIGTDYPSPKNVPMFNEVTGSFLLQETPVVGGSGGATYVLTLNLNFELWYPFPSSDNDGGSFRLEAPLVGGGPRLQGTTEQIWMPAILRGGTNIVPVELQPVATPPGIDIPVDFNNGRPFGVEGAEPHFLYTFNLIRPAGNTDPLPPSGTLTIRGLQVQKPVYLTAGGAQADMLPAVMDLSPQLNLTHSAAPQGPFARAVSDPRLNHLTGQWVEESGGSGTMGQMNQWSTQGGNPDNVQYRREGTNLYCRNAPMETPAELGFISVGEPWQTIDLCTEEGANLMAKLVTDTNLFAVWQTNGVFYTNGTINPNTRSSNVLASVFYELSTQEVPNVPTAVAGANPVDEETAYFIAGEILKATQAGTLETAFQAGTDWVGIDAMRQGGPLSSAYGLNNNQREAFLRNTWGTFNPENSLFTVVVVAQAIKEGPNGIGIWDEDDDLIVGERRAAALVWRDPFKTGNNLHHEMFVRMIRHLSD
jgi:hypothetical protein